MKILKGLVLVGLLTFISGCSAGGSLDHYADMKPALKLEDYFNGPIKAWGIVQDRSGNITRRFSIDLVGSWDGDIGTLEEDFKYYDGETQRRVWTITKTADQSYEGRASDIIGKATGSVNGNAVQWAYQMNIDVGDNSFKITFDDWMFLMEDGVMINRSYLKKFGITVAELTLFMQKADSQ
jgi:hypothetical protein